MAIMVKIKPNYHEAGLLGRVLGESIEKATQTIDGIDWLPVLFENVDDPTFFKLAGLEILGDVTRKIDDTFIDVICPDVMQLLRATIKNKGTFEKTTRPLSSWPVKIVASHVLPTMVRIELSCDGFKK